MKKHTRSVCTQSSRLSNDWSCPSKSHQEIHWRSCTIVGEIMTIFDSHSTNKTRHHHPYLQYHPNSILTTNSIIVIKPRNAKLPQLTAYMTRPQFPKFKIDWDVFKDITSIPSSQYTSQLYSAFILIHCMIFLSPFLDVKRMSISTFFFLAQLDSGIFYL